MPSLSLKPDTSFFRKIATGAVGTRAIVEGLNAVGHDVRELERGALDTKLWKEVKRKRVRIPDLVCVRCGQRVESKAKTTAVLSLSHSDQAERSWDYGMVPTDWFAFPVIQALKPEEGWSRGTLEIDWSYWHERNWLHWRPKKKINYFALAEFRRVPKSSENKKGAEEASEIEWVWDAKFASQAGVVASIAYRDSKHAIRIKFDAGRGHTWTVPQSWHVEVHVGDHVEENGLLASPLRPIDAATIQCRGGLNSVAIDAMLSSRERTVRFTGVKLARLLADPSHETVASNIAQDQVEDIYVRLEGVSYLVAVCGKDAEELFRPYLASSDDQNRLEAVIALGETRTRSAVEMLCRILDNHDSPYFLRSAAAWALSQAGSDNAIGRLIKAFADLDEKIREEALFGIVSSSGASRANLLYDELEKPGNSEDIAAGCAEALRQLSVQNALPNAVVEALIHGLANGDRRPFSVWLAGGVSKKQFSELVAQMQATQPETHFAITVLWAFMESWIAKRWERDPRGHLSEPPI